MQSFCKVDFCEIAWIYHVLAELVLIDDYEFLDVANWDWILQHVLVPTISCLFDQAMGELGDHRALPVLLEGLRDKNPLVVEQTEKVHFHVLFFHSYPLLACYEQAESGVWQLNKLTAEQLLRNLVNLIVY